MNMIAELPCEQDLAATDKPNYPRLLRKRFHSELKELSKVSKWKGLAYVLADWLTILGVASLAIYTANPVGYLFAMFIIATRQHALLIIMHDASHYRLVPNRRLNDLLSNLLIAYPMLIRTDAYRQNHLMHHSHTNTDDDPDWIRKADNPEWKFPKTRFQIARMLLNDLLGGGFINSLIAIYDLGMAKKTNASFVDRVGQYSFLAVSMAIAIANGFGLTLFLLWYLPSFTFLPAILRIRSIAEHFGVENVHDLNASRNYHCNVIEQTIFAPHNVDYHLDHHLFPSVPFYNLQKLHLHLLTDPNYSQESHQSTGLFGVRRPTVERDVTSPQAY